ncbi:MAG: DUF4399 domain-containing protein [Gammaproteobacteria bacterium]|nr:DUF4399 domain-containing protein [Gammaproteobacteria bacterium]
MRICMICALALALVACGQDSPPPATTESEPEPMALQRTPSPEGARVFFISPADGATVSNPIRVEFGIEGMTVAKAGVEQAHSGHHHLLIDADVPDLSLPIPADDRHIHFGDGSTSTEISLPAGRHSLRMVLGDYRHVPHDPPVVSEPITITVE